MFPKKNGSKTSNRQVISYFWGLFWEKNQSGEGRKSIPW